MGLPPSDASFAIGFASSAAFAATLPLGNANAVPNIVRVGIALAMAPLFAMHLASVSHSNLELAEQALLAAAIGAAIGLSASVLASAAGAAGSLVDHAIGGGLSAAQTPGDGTGPFALVLPLAFGYALCSSGALAHLMVGVAGLASTLEVHVSAVGATGLARVAFEVAAVLALPPLCANALATMFSGIVARVAPRSSGMLLVPALGSPLALCTVIAGAGSTLLVLRNLAIATSHVVRHL
ncbi:MAG TPA: flagellar biosynthetic protein FliR [Candidatus Eremiobacteraceae bacterium]|nr:flagellar biosynthetic protein FliR [Candidatus Eremiobacteraceae bacterium]